MMDSPPLLVLLPPPPIRSYDTHRRLINGAQRRETSAVREQWIQSQQTTVTSPQRRIHPLSAPPGVSTSTGAVTSCLRNRWINAHRPIEDGNSEPSKEIRQEFSSLEHELNKKNVSKRLPYFQGLQVETTPKWEYPSDLTSYRDVFFASATGAPQGIENPRCKSARKERFFVHPEWASEEVGWKRYQHRSNPDRFRYSWM